MFIKVLCNDKSSGLVEDCNLNDLILRNLVAAYYCPNSNVWVDVQFSFIRMTFSLKTGPKNCVRLSKIERRLNEEIEIH